MTDAALTLLQVVAPIFALILAGYLLGENYETLYQAIRPYELVIYAVVVIGSAYVIYRWARGRGGPKAEPAGKTSREKAPCCHGADCSPPRSPACRCCRIRRWRPRACASAACRSARSRGKPR